MIGAVAVSLLVMVVVLLALILKELRGHTKMGTTQYKVR